ncbi:nuclear transport factor 2 family protein [Labrenzia sp. DG1229]|uniref:nuclear transport factor 2 family protein n=1 Tax=Labrenzia sp. DG1229 TaxID=681847 RepID=UPI00155DD64A|nr:nuclear transport factor 2 family protein [Labrenzia sp. DG1229]
MDKKNNQLAWPIFTYAWAFDECNSEELATVFTEDTSMSWQVEGGALEGPFAGRDLVMEKVSGLMQTHTGQWRHIVTNQLVEELSESTATVLSYFMLLEAGGSAVKLIMCGWYRDQLRFERGEWRIADRHIHMDNGF